MATKTEMQARIKQLEVENENLANTLELVRSQRDKAIDYGSLPERCDEQQASVEELEQRVSAFESERQQLIAERHEVERRNDDLSIRNSHLEMELKKWMESHVEAMRHGLQLEKEIVELKHIAEARLENYKMMCDRADRARMLVQYYLYVELARSGEREDQRQCSQVQRFIYMLQDTLDGK